MKTHPDKQLIAKMNKFLIELIASLKTARMSMLEIEKSFNLEIEKYINRPDDDKDIKEAQSELGDSLDIIYDVEAESERFKQYLRKKQEQYVNRTGKRKG